jgi:hypothetical protein
VEWYSSKVPYAKKKEERRREQKIYTCKYTKTFKIKGKYIPVRGHGGP